MNYTIIGSFSDELNEQTKLFQFRSICYLDSQIEIDKFNKIESGNILAYGSFSGHPILSLSRKYFFTSENNNLSAFLQIKSIYYGIEEDRKENIQALNNLEILLASIIMKSCKKTDNVVNTNDIKHIFGYRTLNKSSIIKLRINHDLNDYYIIASYFLREDVLKKVKDESQFSLITRLYKRNSQKKSSRIHLTT